MKPLIVALLALSTLTAMAQDAPPFAGEDAYPKDGYDTVAQRHTIHGYTLELWVNQASQGSAIFVGNALRILSPQGEVYDIQNATLDWDLRDLNNDEILELVIEGFSGGAHCCSSIEVLSLDPEKLRNVFSLQNSDCGVVFRDVDGDGTQEIIGCDASWNYAYCAYAFSPVPTMVWAWRGDHYQVANTEAAYRSLFENDLKRASSVLFEAGQEGSTPECRALEASLPYLYLGAPALAEQMLRFTYNRLEGEKQFSSATALWQDVQATAQTSVFYQAVE